MIYHLIALSFTYVRQFNWHLYNMKNCYSCGVFFDETNNSYEHNIK
jgi:hypothetical protein